MSGAEARAAFMAGRDAVEETQKRLLRQVLGANAGCRYGRRHHFAQIGSAEDFRRRVPLVHYEEIRASVDAMLAGEKNILSAERVLAFFKTSGSLAAPKLIPVTASLVRQKLNAFGVYWSDVYRAYPALASGRVVSNLSDSGAPEKSPAGVDILSEATFWSRRGQGIQRHSRQPLPPALRRVPDPWFRAYAAARLLLQGELHGIMCLNPSTLLFFCRQLQSHIDALLAGLQRGDWGRDDADFLQQVDAPLGGFLRADRERAAQVAAALQQGFCLRALWPQLALSMCWCSRLVSPYFEQLAPFLKGVASRDFITQSSECAIAIPLRDGRSGGALAYSAHFFEFIAEGETQARDPQTRFAWQLQPGCNYEVVVTTGGGLYRYRTGDCVRVSGFMQQLPVLEFLYRLGKTASISGEKLTEFQVSQAAEQAAATRGGGPLDFICFPRSGSCPHYGVIVETGAETDTVRAWLAAFEHSLQAVNTEYKDKRASGRLGSPRGFIVAAGAIGRYRRRRKAAAVSDAQLKTEVLTSALDIDAAFAVQEIAGED